MGGFSYSLGLRHDNLASFLQSPGGFEFGPEFAAGEQFPPDPHWTMAFSRETTPGRFAIQLEHDQANL